jgi:hypothetical protein
MLAHANIAHLQMLRMMLVAGAGMASAENFHEFKANNAAGAEVDMATYKGKVLLVTNVASQ